MQITRTAGMIFKGPYYMCAHTQELILAKKKKAIENYFCLSNCPWIMAVAFQKAYFSMVLNRLKIKLQVLLKP